MRNGSGHKKKPKMEGKDEAEAVLLPPPSNNFISPILNDLYQVTMAAAYYTAGTHETHAVFEGFIRKCPFEGEIAIFAGMEDVEKFICNFKFGPKEIRYLKGVLPNAPPDFFEYLEGLDGSRVTVYGMAEGTVVFPREPLIKVEGPLIVCQLLETPLLNLLNYATLVATNAARIRMAAGDDKTLLEFGLRRAQGPDGGMTASRSSIIGGFDGTSNIAAGLEFDIPIRGTHAHSFVTSFKSPSQLGKRSLGSCADFWQLVMETRETIRYKSPNLDELVAFVAYAIAFPHDFNALVDTYDSLTSGVPNFLAVAVAMHKIGLKAKGIRLDSGDLATLSITAKQMFATVGVDHGLDLSYFIVVASNDINEKTLLELNAKGHAIDSFGIGTNLVTCQSQPALGMVFKLAEINDEATIKLSNDPNKVTIPGNKRVFRLFNKEDVALCDYITLSDEPAPQPGNTFIGYHPSDSKRTFRVTPASVTEILRKVIEKGLCLHTQPSVTEIKAFAKRDLARIPDTHKHLDKPAPYPVLLSPKLNIVMHDLWSAKVPVKELA